MVDNLYRLLDNPEQLGERTPCEWFSFFKSNGFEPKPLSRGSLKNIPYEDGGGFKVNWDSEKVFQYHPAHRSHHNGAYYKLSSGVTGTNRYDMYGNLFSRRL